MSNLDLEQPNDFKAAVKMVYGNPVEIYDNALIICTERWSKEKSIIYDFSMWDTKKIIGVISMHPNVNNNEEPRINIIPKQKVFRYKDGTILWAPQLQ